MSLVRLESLRHEMKKCVRCSLCKLIPIPKILDSRFTSACPPVDEYHFHAYSGEGARRGDNQRGGRGYFRACKFYRNRS